MTRTRYLSVAAASAGTGTVNCAAQAAVFCQSCVDRSMRHVPPTGSLTCTDTGPALWLRSVIANSISYTESLIFSKSTWLRSQTTSKALPIFRSIVSSFGV